MKDIRVRLKDPTGQFYDPETGLRVVKAETVRLGSRVGRKTQEWLNAGGLVFVEEDSVASPQEAAAAVEGPPPPDSPSPPPLPFEEEAPKTAGGKKPPVGRSHKKK